MADLRALPDQEANPSLRYAGALIDRPILFTDRLLLRRPGAEDMAAIIEIAGDWEVARRLARMPHPYGTEQAQFFLDVIVPAELVWMIVQRSSGRAVGVVGLTASEEHAGRVELGYYVARGEWGHGIATEAAAAAVRFGFEALGCPCITSGYFADNPASGRVLHKLGFEDMGTAQRPCLAAGAPQPSIEVRLENRAAADAPAPNARKRLE